MRLEQQRVVLTGAASGIGRALLERLAGYPAQVLAADVNAAGLEQALDAVKGRPAQVSVFVGDLGRAEQVDALFEQALARMGGIDLFFANAGFPYYESLEVPDWEHIEKIYRVNVFSPIYAALKLRQVSAGRAYRVVVTASAMGMLALPGYALYSSTKAALQRFAEAYRFELGERAALTMVYPIGTRTQFFQAASQKAAPQTFPSQSAEQVARLIVRGVERDRADIYPSLLFRVFIGLDRYLPFLRRVEQWIELKRFERWRKGDTVDMAERNPPCPP
jgi:short-subunit dehydrogenase